jgi:N-methylhydantoinase A
VTVPLDSGGPLAAPDLDAAVTRFSNRYEERFGRGSGYREAGVEMVNFRVHGSGLLRKPALTGDAVGDEDPSEALVESRLAYFAPSRDFLDASCYAFESLAPGNIVEGPAIVWSPDTTVVVNPGQRLRCDQYKNLELVWGEADFDR